MWRAPLPRGLARRPPLRPRCASQKYNPVASIFSPKVLAAQAAVIVTGTVGLLYYNWRLREFEAWEQNTTQNVESRGRPDIGGTFTLVSTKTGVPTTQADFLGKWLLLYFGFANCPEICPEEMHKVGRAVDGLEVKFGKGVVQPVFVTIDPGRDSVAACEDLLTEYHPSFLGLTGTPKQIEACARKWRVYYTTPDMIDAQAKDDYLVDHSIITYLVDPTGEFRAFFSKEFTSANIITNVTKQIEKYNASLKPF
eukprot:EG_transcript_19809